MMTKEVAQKIAELVESKTVGVKCKVVELKRTNDVRAIGIEMKKDGSRLAETADISKIHSENMTEKDIDNVACYIAKLYASRNMDVQNAILQRFGGGPQKVTESVVFRVVNAEMNKKRLKEMPHFNVLDLAVVYTAPVKHEKYGTIGYGDITNKFVEKTGISEHELYEIARENTKKHYEFFAEHIKQHFIKTGVPEWMLGQFDIPMYVCTSKDGVAGAAIMLYPEYFVPVAEKEGCDLYIIPCSIHEVLAVPVTFTDDPDGLRELCNEVNTEEVKPEEVLGNTIYRYVKEKNEIVIVQA